MYPIGLRYSFMEGGSPWMSKENKEKLLSKSGLDNDNHNIDVKMDENDVENHMDVNTEENIETNKEVNTETNTEVNMKNIMESNMKYNMKSNMEISMEKKEELKKMSDLKCLIIYLVLSFGLTFLWFFITIPKGQTWLDMSNEMQSFVALGMIFPMIAHVLTRFITKEGFSLMGEYSMMLGISFRNKKWIYFLLAVFLPWLFTELGNVIELIMNPNLFDPEYYLTLEIDQKFLMLLPANAMIICTIASFAALGEEGGWRGYMMPKLMKLTGRKRALFLGGVIWGLWHAPLTCIGHNFGLDYIGFPYLGILKMCVLCILLGVLLTFVTEKSGSIWPAAIMHAVNNGQPSILLGYMNPEKAGVSDDVIFSISGRMVTIFLVTVVVWIVWSKSQKKK